MLATVMMVAGISISRCEDDDVDLKKLKEIQGNYSVAVMKAGGKNAPQGFLKQLKYAVRDNKLIANVGMGKKEDPVQIKLDPSKKPAHIDFEETRPDGTVARTYGIYKFADGELTICAVDSNKPEDRPKDFEATKPKQFLLVLKRDVPAKK